MAAFLSINRWSGSGTTAFVSAPCWFTLSLPGMAWPALGRLGTTVGTWLGDTGLALAQRIGGALTLGAIAVIRLTDYDNRIFERVVMDQGAQRLQRVKILLGATYYGSPVERKSAVVAFSSWLNVCLSSPLFRETRTKSSVHRWIVPKRCRVSWWCRSARSTGRLAHAVAGCWLGAGR